MTKKIKKNLLQGVKLSLTVLLLSSSNQTALFAGSYYSHDYQEILKLSNHHNIRITSQYTDTAKASGHYSVKVYSAEKSKLISAMTRQLTGVITDVLVEDINDDKQPDIVVMMQDYSRGKQYLSIDTFSFNGKKMVWKQQLPKGFISVQTDSYLKKHQIPIELSRNTATTVLH